MTERECGLDDNESVLADGGQCVVSEEILRYAQDDRESAQDDKESSE